MRARYYDPISGCFLSEDASRSAGNTYAYAGGSPNCRTDASGRLWSQLWEIVGTIYYYLTHPDAIRCALGELFYELDCKYNGRLSRFLMKKLGMDAAEFWTKVTGYSHHAEIEAGAEEALMEAEYVIEAEANVDIIKGAEEGGVQIATTSEEIESEESVWGL